MLEEFETVTVAIQFDAFELLDRDADAKALHGECFAPHYAGLWKKVTRTAQRCVVKRDKPSPSKTVRNFRALNSWPSAVSNRMVVAMCSRMPTRSPFRAQAVPHGFSHGGAEDGDEKEGKSGHHEAWAYRMSRGLSPGVQSARS